MVMSALGLVSRVTPVQTAMRNCTRDEGWPFEVGNQVLVSSHRKLLWSKAMVVSVAENRSQIPAGKIERGERKQTMVKCRKRIRRCQNRGLTLLPGISLGDALRLPKRHPACRRREAQSGSCTERENLAGDAKGKGASGSNREAQSTDAPERGALPRSSYEAG